MRIRSAGWIATLALLAASSLAFSAAATEEMGVEAGRQMERAPSGHVARAAFTTLVADREPQDEVSRLTNEHNRIIFFTDLRDLAGRNVFHVWEHDGAVMARVPFSVKGPRWRIYSTKNLEPSWVGEWTVKVVDEKGEVLHTETFSYVSVADASGTETAPPASIPME